MKTIVDIPDYNVERGLSLTWQDGFFIIVEIADDKTLIKANSAGLISLANHLLTLAQSEVPAGHHIHYDDMNSLEDGSSELIIEKM